VLERQPGNPVARVGLIEALLSQRRYAEAAASAEREPADSIVRPVVALAELFAHAAAGESDALAAALERAPAAGVTPAELELYTAWASVLAGGETPGSLSAEAASPTEQALEALLRVQEFDAFERLLPLLRATELGEQERHDRLARLYFRLGYLESAADEWIAVVERAPTAPALVGLAQVAVARGLLEDAGELAEKAVRLDPDLVEARRLAEVLRERSRGARVAVLAPS
jgi:tetratricopeptide (TPR) repeat protein